jgi:serine/threonine protein kinase/Tfp pilus assembly protein PilF
MLSDISANSNLLHYRIISKIGSGGMGDVYLAEDTKLGRKVALKLLSEQLASDEEKLERFIREARMASGLNHPNILTVYEIGEAHGRNFIVTELIEGMTLRERLAVSGRLSAKETLQVAVQVAEALSAAHRAGVIHRDIKPENIMIRADGYAKVLDFGLAKLVEKGPEGVDAQFRTRPGIVMGTVAYMSPEQARGQDLDARSDVFSLGSVIYEMLAGKQAFHGETQSHALVAILEKDPEPLPGLSSAVDEELDRITRKALSKSVDDRYPSAEELVAELRTVKRRHDLENIASAIEAPTAILSVHPPSDVNTIAVLPFVNMSRDENGDYFSDGLAEELLNVLTKIRGLRVAARTSAFAFKGKTVTISEIGRALNVASVLEGSIRIAGEQVRIAVQLIEVATGYRLWSESYNRKMDDIFAIQDDIAQSVVGELRVRLLGVNPGKDTTKKVLAEIADAVRGRAADPEAQRLMLLGRHFLDLTTRTDTAKAVGYFNEAVQLDPAYALGWAELGRSYAVQAGKAWVRVEDGYESSRLSTQRALELEPDLAEAHAQLGRIRSAYEMDMLGARESYQRALDLAPGSAVVMDGASILELKCGHLDEALELSRRVLAQDPLSGAMWHNLGLICHAAGLFAEAEDALARALELSPSRTVTAAMMALAVLDQGSAARALEITELEPDNFWKLWAQSMIRFAAGQGGPADDALVVLIGEYSAGDAYQIAEVFAFRGEPDNAFDWLERSLAERDPGITHALSSPRLRNLHEDKRWPLFLKKIGLSAV